EVRLIVADYFDMLEAEMLGEPYKKSEHRKALVPHLSGRSEGSIEFKYQNVSGVLVEMGLPYIDGYKPRSNYQSMLATEIESFLNQRPGSKTERASAPKWNPTQPTPVANLNLEVVIEDPPERIIAPAAMAKPWLSRKARKIDFAERD